MYRDPAMCQCLVVDSSVCRVGAECGSGCVCVGVWGGGMIICIIDLFIYFLFFKSSMSVYCYQFKCFSRCSDVLFTCIKKEKKKRGVS